MGEKMRLDRLISSQSRAITRADVKKLCLKKKISVNGKLMARSDTRVDTDDEIIVDGKRIEYKKFIYIMLNKPQGVVCSTKDGDSKTVLELVPPELDREGLFPAGRLDKDTEGFVLLTDDGVLAHRMLSPKSHVPKTYLVHLEKPCDPAWVDIMAKGMTIPAERGGEQEPCLPAELRLTEDPCLVFLVLHEGRFHQVKRMFSALGDRVTYLKRTAIGDLELDPNLPLGQCLEIMHKDKDKLLGIFGA